MARLGKNHTTTVRRESDLRWIEFLSGLPVYHHGLVHTHIPHQNRTIGGAAHKAAVRDELDARYRKLKILQPRR